MRSALAIGVLALTAMETNAVAGTMSHDYAVASFERVSADRARLVLRALPGTGEQIESPCRDITATIAYRPEFFLRQTCSRTLTRTTHRQAIAALDSAARKGSAVGFGVFDALAPDPQGRCALDLRGLDVTPDNQILGFNRPI